MADVHDNDAFVSDDHNASNPVYGWDDGDGPLAPVQPERPAKLPLFRPPEAGAPYPVDALPSVLAAAVFAIVDKARCDPAIAAASVLGAASLAAMPHADVVMPHGGTAPLALYLFTVADTGDRKTRADKLAMSAIAKAELQARQKVAEKWTTHRAKQGAWEEAVKHAKRVLKENPEALEAELLKIGDAPPAPLDPLFTLAEPTIAAIEKTFQNGRPALGLFSNEGGKAISGHGFKDENKVHFITSLNDLWGGDPIRRTRAGDGNCLMPGRRLALHLMLQPILAPRLLADPEAVGTGLVARLLVAAPPSRPGERLWRESKPESEYALMSYDASLSALLDRPMPTSPHDPRHLTPRRLTFMAHAKDAWIAWHDSCQIRIRPGGRWEAIRGWGEKGAEHAARLAGVLALIDDPEATMIDVDTMERAIRLADYYGGEAARLAGQPVLDARTQDAADLLEWIKAKGWDRFPLQHVYQFGPKRLRTAAQAREACERLEHAGEIAPMPDGLVIDGKRLKEAWRVVPD